MVLDFDQHPRPQRTGEVRGPKFEKYIGYDKIMWRHAHGQEVQATRKKKASNRLGRHIDTQLVIVDLKGLALMPDKVGIKLFQGASKMDEVRLACMCLTIRGKTIRSDQLSHAHRAESPTSTGTVCLPPLTLTFLLTLVPLAFPAILP